MRMRTTGFWCAMLVVATVCGVSWVSQAQPPGADKKNGGLKEKDAIKDEHRVSVETARDRAQLMHGIFAATLESMHRHYFHANRAVLPARAMEDIFADVEQDHKIRARWISVNTKAMSIEHEIKTEFDRRTASAVVAGQESFELVEGGVYRRGTAIPLGAGCISCHTTSFAPPSKAPRFAALIVEIPIRSE